MAEGARIGAEVQRLRSLRAASESCVGGTLTSKTERGSTVSLPLYGLDIEACLDLLIERSEQWLVSMGVSTVEPYL